MKNKNFYLNTSDNIRLNLDLSLSNKNSSTIVILCHGITADKDEGGIFIDLAKSINDTGFDCLRFDFRGHGKSFGLQNK